MKNDMKRKSLMLAAAILIVLAAASLFLFFLQGKHNEGGATVNYVSAVLDTPFQMKYGKSALINDGSTEIKIKFLNVTGDSRCPKGVQCVWAGQVTLLVGIAMNEHDIGNFSIPVMGYGYAGFDSYALTLSEVRPPYPATIQEYSATFRLSKTVSVSAVYLAEGQREGPLLVQKIYPDRVEGLNFIEYPLADRNGTPITLYAGQSARNGCTITLTLLGIEGGRAKFSEKIETNKPCPSCLSENTLIDTPNGLVRITDFREGMGVWTEDSSGARILATILKTSKIAVPPTHQMVRLVLADGRELFASPGHPLADGRILGEIKAGDIVDGSAVMSAEPVPYGKEYTYDILPSGDTGAYWAGGILVGSTLAAGK